MQTQGKKYAAKTKGNNRTIKAIYHTTPDCREGLVEVPETVVEFFNLELCGMCNRRDNRIVAKDVIDKLIAEYVASPGLFNAQLIIDELEKFGFKIRLEKKNKSVTNKIDQQCDNLKPHRPHFYGDGAHWCEGVSYE